MELLFLTSTSWVPLEVGAEVRCGQRRLLLRLADELRARSEAMSGGGHSDLVEYRPA